MNSGFRGGAIDRVVHRGAFFGAGGGRRHRLFAVTSTAGNGYQRDSGKARKHEIFHNL